MTEISFYSFPTKILFGNGVSHQLAERLHELEVKRPLLVADQAIVQLPWWQGLSSRILEEFQAEVFSDIVGNPTESQVAAGTAIARECNADAIVAIGGGAPCDVAKAIALMQHHSGQLFDYEDGRPEAPPIDQPIAHILAIPTTAGTGSEVGRSAVISEEDTHKKRILYSPRLLPECVLADPELTIGLPAKITAATGIDALTHCIEAFLSKGDHPICDGIALEGIHLISQSLVECFQSAQQGIGATPVHLRARGKMLQASMMGAVAFQKGLGVVHSCAHALSAVCDLHHGLANALMLETCMRFNLPYCQDKYSRMARAIGLENSSPTSFLGWLHELLRETEIPVSLEAVGVTGETIDSLVKFAMADTCHTCNPLPVDKQDFRQLFTEAMEPCHVQHG